jgi:hypothetical protein
MLFIAKFTITCPQASCSKKQSLLLKEVYNHLVYGARLCRAQLFQDFEVEYLDYYNGESDAKLHHELIYLYKQVEHICSSIALAKLCEGCAYTISTIVGVDIQLKFVDSLPIDCPPCYNPDTDEYPNPEMLK